jgi:transposase-like protein
MVKRALKKAKGVVAQAAKELGVSATAVHYWRRHHPEVG